MSRKAALKLICAVTALLLPLVSIPASAYGSDLSPALDLIENSLELKKCGMVGHEVSFKATDFEDVLGVKRLEYITVTSLPDPADGVLKLAGMDVLVGQTISRGNIDKLVFNPYPDKEVTARFTFKGSNDNSDHADIGCVLSVLSTLNFAPEAGAFKLETQRDIAVFKNMKAADPDGDELNYRVLRAPTKGTLKVVDEASGEFMYVPRSGFTGKDTFIYQAVDKYGNESDPATVTLNVVKPASSVYFSDLSRHWAHNSAIKIVSAGVMQAAEDNGELVFKPDAAITRAEFLCMAMKAAGLDKDVNAIYDTGFADNDDIPVEYRGYVAKALSMNIIRGIDTPTGVYFDPNNTISRAEAAVIINNIIKAPAPANSPVFRDAAAIPAWAGSAISALKVCGIINGSPAGEANPTGLVDRAQCAQMLVNLQEYKPASQNKWFFGLF